MSSTPSPSLFKRTVWIMSIVVAGVAATLTIAAARAAESPTTGSVDPTVAAWAFIGAALSTALSALGAGYAVARVGSAAMGAIAEKPDLFGRAVVLVGLAEGIAIYGLIVSILILNRVT